MADYDFIVVGTGSAGGVVSNRLTENPNVQVLALEAGGAEVPPAVHEAPIWYTLLGSPVDWGYTSVPQPGLNGRQTYEPRGKIPGGSSNLYIMMHIRGFTGDYDAWAYNGAYGWTYEECLPWFKKLEDQEDDTSPWAGHGGPLPVINAGKHNPNPTSRVFLDACKELGFPSTEDFNGPNIMGAGWHHINVKDGKRVSVYRAYVEPALQRPNYHLEANAQATRLLFEGKRCVGVEYSQDGALKTARAKHEVVVTCGAIESPKLLLLSGIGQPDALRQFDIPLVSDVPGVGENFHNHVLTGVINEMAQPVPPGQQNLSEACLFVQSTAGWWGPDIQMAFVHVPFNIIVGQGHPNSVSILPGVVRPLSRGWIRLASANPLDKPLVNPNYLGDRSDLERLVWSTKLAREIFATEAFRPWIKEELMPGPDVKDEAQLVEFVKSSADSYHHQAGSCKMGVDNLAVVDPKLRVYGVDGLRVADASVMPFVQSGNCHTGIMMIGERLADWLKQDYGLGA